MEQKISIDDAYSSEPWWYDIRGFLILTFAYQSTLPAQIRLFSRNMGPHHLEVAVGSGTLLKIILDWRKLTGAAEVQITAFDYAQKMLLGARKRFAKTKNIELLRADAARLHFADNTFDTANIANAIHSFPEVLLSLKEIFRVLKRGGTLAGNCLLYPKGSSPLARIANRINSWGMKKGILHRPYTSEEIKSMLELCGFKITWDQVTRNSYDFIAQKP